MGYSVSAVTVFGIQIPTSFKEKKGYQYIWDTEQVVSIANILLPEIDWGDEQESDFWDNIQSGIPIPTNTMGSPYKLIQYNHGDDETAWFIVLDEIPVRILKTADPIVTKIQEPSTDEVNLFVEFMRSKGIYWPYGQYTVLSGGA